MSAGVIEVVKIVAPIAMKALVAAAESLIAGDFYSDKRRSLGLDGSNDSQTLQADTYTYVTTNFATTYGYYYEGLRSQPVNGAIPIAGASDMLIWDSGGKDITDIGNYLQTVFKDQLSPSDSIEIAQNLAALFQDRFAEESLEWTPMNKRFNFPDKLIVDCYMLTACARDASNKLSGIVQYIFVAYKG